MGSVGVRGEVRGEVGVEQGSRARDSRAEWGLCRCGGQEGGGSAGGSGASSALSTPPVPSPERLDSPRLQLLAGVEAHLNHAVLVSASEVVGEVHVGESGCKPLARVCRHQAVPLSHSPRSTICGDP